MRELTDEEEEALGLAYAHRDEALQTYSGKAARAFIQLADAGMIDAEDGGMSGNLVLVRKVLLEGRKHLDLVRESLLAAGVEPLSADADRALRDLAWEETCAKADKANFSHAADESRREACGELARRGMIDTIEADDDAAFYIHSLTDAGWKYVRAMVPTKEGGKVDTPSIQISPVFNNSPVNKMSPTIRSMSNSQSQSGEFTLDMAVDAVSSVPGLTDEQREQLNGILTNLERATTQDDARMKAGRTLAWIADKSFDVMKAALPFVCQKLLGM